MTVGSFELLTYHRRLLEGMVATYNAETEYEPHIARLTPELFTALVEAKSYFEPAGLTVAVENDRVVGWIHACVAPGSEKWHDPEKPAARIRMLVFPRDRLDVGRELVATAVAWLNAAGHNELEAMHAKAGYPFYRGLWMGGEPMCPATLPHIQLTFEVAGFKNTQESIFMVAEVAEPPSIAAAAESIDLIESPAKMAHQGMRESWVGFEPMRTSAMRGREVAGSIGWVLLPHVERKLGAPCVNIWGLGVEEAHRRKGIATQLVSHVLARGHGMGARFASVGTQLWNRPAHATYAKLGFKPYALVIGRSLKVAKHSS